MFNCSSQKMMRLAHLGSTWLLLYPFLGWTEQRRQIASTQIIRNFLASTPPHFVAERMLEQEPDEKARSKRGTLHRNTEPAEVLISKTRAHKLLGHLGNAGFAGFQQPTCSLGWRKAVLPSAVRTHSADWNSDHFMRTFSDAHAARIRNLIAPIMPGNWKTRGAPAPTRARNGSMSL